MGMVGGSARQHAAAPSLTSSPLAIFSQIEGGGEVDLREGATRRRSAAPASVQQLRGEARGRRSWARCGLADPGDGHGVVAGAGCWWRLKWAGVTQRDIGPPTQNFKFSLQIERRVF